MPDRIAAKGLTRVVLVLNMKQFVPDEAAKRRFETLRGTDDLADTLQESWPRALQSQTCFAPLADGEMTDEDVGFATGVFRSLMLRRLTAPTYRLDKSQVTFSDDLESNFQFKTLFRRAWDRWQICIRPTMTGFFVIRLTYDYRHQPRTLIDLAKDAIKLQESLDVPSAVNWLRYNRRRYEEEPEKLAEKERSVKAFLAWLGVDIEKPESDKTLYYPVQWKVAIEAVNIFLREGLLAIPHDDGDIELRPSPPTVALSAHDSYIIYHFDELLAEPEMLDRARRGKIQPGAKISVSLNQVRHAKKIRNELVNLLEGTVLLDPAGSPDDELDGNGYFPSARWSRADSLFADPDENLASWNDELCLFTARTALIMPSRKWRSHEMAVSTVPSATLKVQYARYWAAIERMVEFVLEVRVLAQLIESDSYRLLGQIADTIGGIRGDMFAGDINIDARLKDQMARAAHLRRVAALAQSISHAQYWGRAEYAVQKADRLFELLDVPQIITIIGRNIDGITSVADHVDELYIADLAEKNNDKATVMSMALAAISFILVVLIMPSFWADLGQVHQQPLLNDLVFRRGYSAFAGYLYGGSTLGIALVIFSVWLLWKAWRRQGSRGVLGYLGGDNAEA